MHIYAGKSNFLVSEAQEKCETFSSEELGVPAHRVCPGRCVHPPFAPCGTEEEEEEKKKKKKKKKERDGDVATTSHLDVRALRGVSSG
jgi:hypothetical protein